MSRIPRKVWVPVALLAAGGVGVALLVATRPQVEARAPEVAAPLVRVVRVVPRDVQFRVPANGTVAPRTESDLVPQVSGEVTWVAESFAAGGFFDAGDPLVRIDPRDYEAALESSRAAVARAESEFSRAGTERQRQRELAERGAASQARIDDAENAFRVAQAQLREARAGLERAERDLERTELRAPFEGRVREESVDVGQFVNRGSAIARLYAVDSAEVRLPVPDRELSYLDLKLGSRGQATGTRQDGLAEVLLHAEFAGVEQTWRGRIVRTEGEIDPRSRMVNVVASVAHPYDTDPPLAVGLFVSAEILGRKVSDAFVLPRAALRDGGEGPRVFVVDAEDRLRFRAVEVLRSRRAEVVVGKGLSAGERVAVSPIGAAVDGMRVRVVEEGAAEVAGAGAAE